MCLAESSVAVQPSLDEYGVDHGQQMNPFEQGSIEIPQVDIELSLSDAQLSELTEHHDPLPPSKNTMQLQN